MHTELKVLVKPKSFENSIELNEDGTYVARVTSAPRDGEANKSLIEVLAKMLKIGASRVEVVKGHTQRRKVVRVADLCPEEIVARLTPQRKHDMEVDGK